MPHPRLSLPLRILCLVLGTPLMPPKGRRLVATKPNVFLEATTIAAVVVYMMARIFQLSAVFVAPLLSSQAPVASMTDLRQRQCLQHALRTAVPSQASVYFGSQQSYSAQLLLELDNNWARPVASIRSATWQVTLEPSSAPTGCHGVVLRVTPLS